MVVQHNMTAINANRYFGMNNNKLSKSLEKLSSGYAINRAGDNAAGLAVSEKMRAQISGINQGVKNAQDGISMVQTFEGALTETDSILQRMRTLAVQSANGTYQDDVDREAIQLEYNQLNDELNQIADTDFNGVVVLNGGQMADGLKQVDGDFDYANKADQVAADNQEKLKALQEEAQKKIDVAQGNVIAAQKALDKTKIDMSNNGAASEWNTVDNNSYDKTAADNLWKDLGLEDSDATEVEITYVVDSIDTTTGEITWTVKSATSNASDKDTYSDDAVKTAANGQIDVTDHSGDGTDVTGKGGFTLKTTTGTSVVGNAIVDTRNAKVGDTVTLKFSNAASQTNAPANIGMDADSLNNTSGLATPTIEVDANLTDGKMTADIADALKTLDQSTVSITYATDGTASVSLVDKDGLAVDGLKVVQDGTTATTYHIQTADGTNLATLTGVNNRANTATVTGATAGDVYTYKNGAWSGVKADGVTPATGTIGAAAAGTAFAEGDTFTATGATAGTFANKEASTNVTIEFGVAVSSFGYSENGGLKVSAGKDSTIDSNAAVAAQDKLAKAQAELKAAQDAYPTELPKGVSKSDSNDASTATLTYKDNITLQVGARTKDSVNFTFKYDSNGLGELEADMDCSARGLKTDQLSLKTQESANAAIDKIDNAINKVSMVRGTFGAVQNRLEHKIDNLNTTSENLTSAESRIRDTNMAEEMMNFTKNQILSQASQSMLAQANQLPQGVLSLLQ